MEIIIIFLLLLLLLLLLIILPLLLLLHQCAAELHSPLEGVHGEQPAHDGPLHLAEEHARLERREGEKNGEKRRRSG